MRILFPGLLLSCFLFPLCAFADSNSGAASESLLLPQDEELVDSDLSDEELIDEMLGLAGCSKKNFKLGCILGTCSGNKVCLPKINLTDPRKNTCSCRPLPKPVTPKNGVVE